MSAIGVTAIRQQLPFREVIRSTEEAR